jgi:hypothetical protein
MKNTAGSNHHHERNDKKKIFRQKENYIEQKLRCPKTKRASVNK